jgi:hypothetical protein
MDRQLEAIKRSIYNLYTEYKSDIVRIESQFSAPSSGLSNIVNKAVDDRLSSIKQEVSDIVTTKSEKERKVIETMLALKINDMINKHVDMHVEYRIKHLEEKLRNLKESIDAFTKTTEKTISNTIDAKMSQLVLQRSEVKASLTPDAHVAHDVYVAPIVPVTPVVCPVVQQPQSITYQTSESKVEENTQNKVDVKPIGTTARQRLRLQKNIKLDDSNKDNTTNESLSNAFANLYSLTNSNSEKS